MMKQFCFEFYPGEVLRQIQFLNLKQKGIYLQIITAHLDIESFSYDFLMNIMCDISDTEKKQILDLFTRTPDGNYQVEWVKNSIEKRVNYLKSRSNNKAGRPKKEKNTSKSYDSHMVDVYVDVNKEENNKGGVGENPKTAKKPKPVKNRKPNSIAEVVSIFKNLGLNGKSESEAQDFWDWYTNANWTQGKAKTPLVDWTAAARRWARPKLSEIDKTKNAQNKSRTIDYSQYKKPTTK